MNDISVETMQIESLAPQISSLSICDAQIEKMLPKQGQHPVRASIIMHGINNAIANGIRRILQNEMENLALLIDPDTFHTTDPFIMIDLIARRVQLIPLLQNKVNEKMRFTFDMVNNSDEPLDVMSAHLICHDARGAFFETYNIATLQPHKEIHFVARPTRGYGRTDAAFASAFTTQCIPLDERPVDLEEPDKSAEPYLPYNKTAHYLQSASVSNPHVYQLIFETAHGDPHEILIRAIETFIRRVNALTSAQPISGQEKQTGGSSAQNTLGEAENSVGLYSIRIHDETHTLGNLFVRTCYDIYPEISFVSFDVDDLESILTIRIRIAPNQTIAQVMKEIATRANKQLTTLLQAIR